MLYAADFPSKITLLRRVEQEGLNMDDVRRFCSMVDHELGRRVEDVSCQPLRPPIVCSDGQTVVCRVTLGDFPFQPTL